MLIKAFLLLRFSQFGNLFNTSIYCFLKESCSLFRVRGKGRVDQGLGPSQPFPKRLDLYLRDMAAEAVLPTSTPSSPPKSLKSPSTKSKWRSYFSADISLQHADLPIIACCLVSGLCDSSAYNAWTCFVSMQTGNTIFLALGASNQPASHPYGWLKSFLSIIFFVLGCVFFANTRHFSPFSRGTLSLSFLLQGLCIFVAAALVQSHVVPSTDIENGSVSFIELVPLGFLAFQSGGQIVTSRILGFNEVPTTVLTSVYCDIASDPKVLAPIGANVKRNRRFGAVLGILIGGIAGGWLSKSKAGMSTALWIAGAIKFIIAVSWAGWKSKEGL